jgi:hypothetical protein
MQYRTEQCLVPADVIGAAVARWMDLLPVSQVAVQDTVSMSKFLGRQNVCYTVPASSLMLDAGLYVIDLIC